MGENDDDEDDDDDDCFFMPMPKAVKWADEKKFSSLAQPIGPDLKAQGNQFVLVMEPGGLREIAAQEKLDVCLSMISMQVRVSV